MSAHLFWHSPWRPAHYRFTWHAPDAPSGGLSLVRQSTLDCALDGLDAVSVHDVRMASTLVGAVADEDGVGRGAARRTVGWAGASVRADQ